MTQANENVQADSDAADDQLALTLRQLGECLHSDGPIDWRETRKRSFEVLRERYFTCPRSQKLKEKFQARLDVEKGGAEHYLIRVESHPDRFFKITYGGAFGCRCELFRSGPDGRHFYASANFDPLFYLRRWALLNSIGEYQTEFEGILPPDSENGQYRICVSQPAVDLANPTEQQVRDAMAAFGFHEVSADAFYSPDSGILLTDAAPRNVRVIGGIPVPFDAIAEKPTGTLLEWLDSRLQGPRE